MRKAADGLFRAYTDEKTFEQILTFDCVAEMWAHSVAAYGEMTALESAKERLTYRELDAQVGKLRQVLMENGVTPGTRVGLFLPNSVSFVAGYLAITTLGAVATPLPAHLKDEMLDGCVRACGLSLVLFDDQAPLAQSAAIAQQHTPFVTVRREAAGTAPAVFVSPAAPCTIMFTGGTTGKSKASLLSHGAMMCGTRNGCYGYQEVFGQRYMLVLPLTHVFGLIRCCLTVLCTGGTLFICEQAKDLFRDAASFRPTMLVLVPALAELALKLSGKFHRNMLGDSVRCIICGAASVPPYLIRKYHEIGIALLPGYGLTESANLVSGNPETLRKPDSVGRVYPDIETRIEAGELWLKGANMQDGYLNPEDNRASYVDGWFKTGDLAYFDEDGFLYITGRCKELIVLPSGENVSPAYLEAKFSAFDLVEDCLVYENEGHLTLEILVREMAAAENGVTDAREAINVHVAKVNAALPSFMRVTEILYRTEDFVRTPSMKIARNLNGHAKK